MQSKFSGNLAQRKSAASVFFVLGFLIFAIFSICNPTASAALGDGTNFKIGLEGRDKDLSARLNAISSSDYTASYSQNFYSAADKNAANTTGNWSTNSGFLSLNPAAAATSAPSYTVEDDSSSLSGFTGPVSMFANNNTIPLIGSKTGSLNLPVTISGTDSMINLGSRLVDFASFDIKSLGFSAYGDPDTLYENTTGSDGQIMLGNDQVYAYFLVAGDNADRSAGTKAVKMNKIRLVSYSTDGKITTQTEDVSSGLTSLGFEAVTDVSCSDTECLIAGTKGKLARYNGGTYTDLSGKLGSTAGNLALAGSEDGYFLIAGSEYSSASGRYVGKIYKYQSGNISKISEDSLFVSNAAGTFGMAFDYYADACLIVRGAENVAAYVYADGKFEDVSSKISKYYTGGVMNPAIYGGSDAWFVINKGTTGSIVRFDGEAAIDIRDSLDISSPVSVIGSNGSGSAILIGGGTASSPKLYKVTESSPYASTSYQSTGVVESIKVNKTTVTITSAYLLASDYIPTGTSLKYYLSADGGTHWQEAIIGANDTSSKVTFQNPGNDLRWKVSMATTDIKRSPSVYGLHIYYTEGYLSPMPILKEGEFVRADNGTKVYMIMNGKKVLLAAEGLLNIKHYWVPIKTLAQDVLDRLPEIKLAKVKGGSAIYYLNSVGMKKLILNDAVFKSYGNRYEDVVEMYDYHLDLYPTVRFIQSADGKVYQVTGATKKWVSNPEEFKKLGGNWSEISSVNAIELAAYQEITTGAPVVQIVDGDIVRASNSQDVYIIKIVGEKKFKRLILTPTVFQSYGHLKWENVKVVDHAVLEGFMTSEFVTLCSKAKVDADCDIYFLHDVYDFADSGYKEIMAKADFVSGRYDLDSVYIINNADFQAYRNSVVSGEGTRQVEHVELLAAMLDLFKSRYGMDFHLNKSKFIAIMEKVVIKERDATTTQMRADFQALLAESGIDAVKRADLHYLMHQGAIFEKYLLDDAMASFDAGKAVESAERRAMREAITAKYPVMAGDFNLLEIGLGQVAKGQPVKIQGITTYFNKQSAEVMLSIYDKNLALRFDQLF